MILFIEIFTGSRVNEPKRSVAHVLERERVATGEQVTLRSARRRAYFENTPDGRSLESEDEIVKLSVRVDDVEEIAREYER